MNEPQTTSYLAVRSLNYQYPGGFPALSDVSFSLERNEKVALIGPSGAGKSTLLLHLNGLLPDRPDAHAAINGRCIVAVDGIGLSAATAATIRQRVGLVFQDPDDQLFCPTVAEDVAFGPLNLGLNRAEIDRRVTDSLAAVGLAGYERRSTNRLSLGERKRVCIAGVLACEPGLLALDEPTNGLDPRARRALIQVLLRFDGSVLVATHDLDLVVELCTRTIVLDSGRIQADGETQSLLTDRALMEQHGLEVPWSLRKN